MSMYPYWRTICILNWNTFERTQLANLYTLTWKVWWNWYTFVLYYMTRITRNRTVYLIYLCPLVIKCSFKYVIHLIKYLPYMGVNLVHAMWKLCVDIGQKVCWITILPTVITHWCYSLYRKNSMNCANVYIYEYINTQMHTFYCALAQENSFMSKHLQMIW